MKRVFVIAFLLMVAISRAQSVVYLNSTDNIGTSRTNLNGNFSNLLPFVQAGYSNRIDLVGVTNQPAGTAYIVTNGANRWLLIGTNDTAGAGGGDTFATNLIQSLANVDSVAAPTTGHAMLWNGAAWSNGAVDAAFVGPYAETSQHSIGPTNGLNSVGTNIYNVISGGQDNIISNDMRNAFIGGGRSNVTVWVNTTSLFEEVGTFIGGGTFNRAANGGVVVGGDDNYANVFEKCQDCYLSFIGGGETNEADGRDSVCVGGENNKAKGNFDFIGSGRANRTTLTPTSDGYNVVAGGRNNTAGVIYDSVGGGYQNTASGNSSTIAGGQLNTIPSTASQAAIGGGIFNTNAQPYGTIGGGYNNKIAVGASGAQYATIAGGNGNIAIGYGSAIAGGQTQTATNICSAVGGGFDNWAGGYASVIPGGRMNHTHGYYSFAAGLNAWASYDSTFVFSGKALTSTGTPFEATTTNTFLVGPNMQVCINTNTPVSGAALTVAGNIVVTGGGYFGSNSVYVGQTHLGETQLKTVYRDGKISRALAIGFSLLLINFFRDRNTRRMLIARIEALERKQ